MTAPRTALPAALALAACAGGGTVDVGASADLRAARRLLAEAAAAGPVRLADNLEPGRQVLPQADLEAAAARGVPNLSVRFAEAPAAGGSARLLLLFDPPPAVEPERACGAATPPAPAPGDPSTELVAIFCDGAAYVAHTTASAIGRGPDETRRLVWRATARLFPDDYADSYGFDLFGNRIGLGGSFSF